MAFSTLCAAIVFALSFVGASSVQGRDSVADQICLNNTLPTNFNLAAAFVAPPPTGAVSVPLHVIMIQAVPHVSWSILTTTSDGIFTSEVLTNGGLLPMSASQPQFRTSSLATNPGDSPIFATTQFPPPAVGPYCTMANPLVPDGPQVLALSGRSDLWALCPNSTAGGRVDVVYSPIDNHPHYNRSNCSAVNITITAV